MKKERDAALNGLRRVALCFFDYFEVESRLANPEFYREVTMPIESLQSQLKAEQESVRQGQEVANKIAGLAKKHNIKSETTLETIK
jgi:hypothetical protein